MVNFDLKLTYQHTFELNPVSDTIYTREILETNDKLFDCMKLFLMPILNGK